MWLWCSIHGHCRGQYDHWRLWLHLRVDAGRKVGLIPTLFHCTASQRCCSPLLTGLRDTLPSVVRMLSVSNFFLPLSFFLLSLLQCPCPCFKSVSPQLNVWELEPFTKAPTINEFFMFKASFTPSPVSICVATMYFGFSIPSSHTAKATARRFAYLVSQIRYSLYGSGETSSLYLPPPPVYSSCFFSHWKGAL